MMSWPVFHLYIYVLLSDSWTHHVGAIFGALFKGEFIRIRVSEDLRWDEKHFIQWFVFIREMKSYYMFSDIQGHHSR